MHELNRAEVALWGERKLDDMIRITEQIALRDDELKFSFVRSSGPGGQNVNSVSTAVQLRFDVRGSPSLSHGMKHRLMKLAGSRMSAGGELVIHAQTHRTQQGNRRDAVARLTGLIRKAIKVPKRRIKTKPTAGSIRRRLKAKQRRSSLKRLRRPPDDE